MKIREDIFPEIVSHEKAQEYVRGLASLAFQAFRGLFSSEEEVVEYVNRFENPKFARLFLEIGKYYYSAKCYYCPNCFPPKKMEKCPHCEKPFEMLAYMVLIMIISVMERLSREFSKYIDFFEWTGRKETIEKCQIKLESSEIREVWDIVATLREEWRKDYGSVTKITEFFKKFLNKEEKIKFIKSIRYFIEVPELPPKHMDSTYGKTAEDLTRIFDNWEKKFEEEQKLLFETDDEVKNYVIKNNYRMQWEALPICFNKEEYWKCYSKDIYGHGQGYCHYNYYCALDTDEILLDNCFTKIVKTVYDWRSGFVHEAQIPPITETTMLSDVYDDKLIIVELTTTELKPVFEKMVKRYFDQYQKQR